MHLGWTDSFFLFSSAFVLAIGLCVFSFSKTTGLCVCGSVWPGPTELKTARVRTGRLACWRVKELRVKKIQQRSSDVWGLEFGGLGWARWIQRVRRRRVVKRGLVVFSDSNFISVLHVTYCFLPFLPAMRIRFNMTDEKNRQKQSLSREEI